MLVLLVVLILVSGIPSFNYRDNILSSFWFTVVNCCLLTSGFLSLVLTQHLDKHCISSDQEEQQEILLRILSKHLKALERQITKSVLIERLNENPQDMLLQWNSTTKCTDMSKTVFKPHRCNGNGEKVFVNLESFVVVAKLGLFLEEASYSNKRNETLVKVNLRDIIPF